MVRETISIQPLDTGKLDDLRKVLRRGSPTLVGPTGEQAVFAVFAPPHCKNFHCKPIKKRHLLILRGGSPMIKI